MSKTLQLVEPAKAIKPMFYLSITGSGNDPQEKFIPFQTLNQASKMYRAFLDHNGFGAREAGKAIIYQGEKQVGHVSFNGRVWDAKGNCLWPEKPLHECQSMFNPQCALK